MIAPPELVELHGYIDNGVRALSKILRQAETNPKGFGYYHYEESCKKIKTISRYLKKYEKLMKEELKSKNIET